MDWLTAVADLRERGDGGVIATLATVRGHAPREAGAKLVVSSDGQWGTIGGGNFEASVIDRARVLLSDHRSSTELMTFALTDKASTTHGVQCCGGEVSVLLEPFHPPRTVAIFGMGHVGHEIARVLARQPISLILVDSRAEAVADERLRALAGGSATLDVRHEPAPETVMAELPAGAFVFVVTHDHAEDLVLCDAALRAEPAYIGLIGSRAKWQRFRKRLGEEGHDPSSIDRITCPIGLPDLTAKDPASIAVGVVADLLLRWQSASVVTATATGTAMA